MSQIKFYKNKDDYNKFICSLGEVDNSLYILLKPNTDDILGEKYVPIYTINNNQIEVNIGSIDHPMTESHYIMWVALVDGTSVNLVKLKPGSLPKVSFPYIIGSKIYAYCNLHGLWESEVK